MTYFVSIPYQYHPEHPSIRVILFRHLNFLCLYIYIDRIPTQNIRRNFQTSPRRYVNKGIFRHKKFYCLNKIARMARMIRINLSISSWASVNPCNHVQTFKIFGASIYYIDRIPTKNIRRNFQTSPRRYVNKGIFRRKKFFIVWTRLHGWQGWSGLTYQCYPEHLQIRVIMFRHLIELFREIRSAPFPKQFREIRFAPFPKQISNWRWYC